MSLLNLVLALLFWLAALSLASVFHELGHVLAGWLVKNNLQSVTFGSGPWRLLLRRHDPKIYIALPIPLGGLCQSRCVDKRGFISTCRRRQMIELLGGPVLNLILGTVMLSLSWSWLHVLGAAQWLLALSQMLPLPGYDGARLWALLRLNEKA